MAHVLSVNIGRRSAPLGKSTPTGIGKQPVDSAYVRAPGSKHEGLGSGVVDDFIGDREHHGGDFQAIYAFAREELDHWEQRLARPLADGWFGENLTTAGLDVDAAILGEEWHIGEDLILRVTAPRIPCVTFATRMGVPGWLRTFTEHGRTGAYLSVVRSGTVATGDPIRVTDRPTHGIDVVTLFRAVMGDRALAAEVLAADCLADPAEIAGLQRVAGR